MSSALDDIADELERLVRFERAALGNTKVRAVLASDTLYQAAVAILNQTRQDVAEYVATHCGAILAHLRSGPTQSFADGFRAGIEAAAKVVDGDLIPPKEIDNVGKLHKQACIMRIAAAIRALPVPDEGGAEEDEVELLRRAKDDAYSERNMLVALLARLYPSGIALTAIDGWDPEWHGCVYIDTPEGQLSWHYHDSEAHLFADLPPYQGQWDGHTTEEKYARIGVLIGAADERRMSAQPGSMEERGADGITNADFARSAAYIAKVAAAWSGDSLLLPEQVSEVMPPETAGRFTARIREMLRYLDEKAKVGNDAHLPDPTEDEVERAAIEVGVKAYFSSPDFWTTRRCVETAIRAAMIAARSRI